MHIIVLIKQVPDTSEVKINRETNTLIRDGVPSIINPFDMFAIEEALRLREQHGGKVTAVTMARWPSKTRTSFPEISSQRRMLWS